MNLAILIIVFYPFLAQDEKRKPIPTPRQNVPAKQQLSPPQIPATSVPALPAPSTAENCKMALQAIQNIMKENPQARKTEIVIQTLNFAAKFCDEYGGYLEVGSKKATLFIPPYALDKATLIFVQIEESYCLIPEDQYQIAPVIHCGEPGTQFQTPVILTFYTTIQDTRYFNVTGLQKETSKDEPASASGNLATKGVRKDAVKSLSASSADWHEPNESTDGRVISLENGKCTMMLYHFTLFSDVGTQTNESGQPRHFGNVGVLAFTSPVMKRGNIFDIRVWMCSNRERLAQVK